MFPRDGSRSRDYKQLFSEKCQWTKVVGCPFDPTIEPVPEGSCLARVYPSLPPETERRIEAIRLVSKNDPDYFTDLACPYPWLKDLLVGGLSDRVVLFEEGQTEDEAIDTVLDEVQATIEELKTLEKQLSMNRGSEPGDMLAVLKAKTTMLEKWTSIKERLLNMKYVRQFQALVIEALDELMDKDQQQTFKRKLKQKAGIEVT